MTPFLTRRSLYLEVCHLPRPLSGVWFCTSLGISPTNCKVDPFFFFDGVVWWKNHEGQSLYSIIVSSASIRNV